MIKLKCIIGVVFFIVSSTTLAQQSELQKAGYKISLAKGLPNLKVGDVFPHFDFGKVIMSDKQKLNSSAFKDQLLILDFWNTRCGSCINALPKMEALQKQFGNRI